METTCLPSRRLSCRSRQNSIQIWSSVRQSANALHTRTDPMAVSAGFDAAVGDELGLCFVSPACYAHMTHGPISLAKGKAVVCLEVRVATTVHEPDPRRHYQGRSRRCQGGYNLHSISSSALAVTRTLMGEPPDRMGRIAPGKIAVNDVHKTMSAQSRYWACMRCRDLEPRTSPCFIQELNIAPAIYAKPCSDIYSSCKLIARRAHAWWDPRTRTDGVSADFRSPSSDVIRQYQTNGLYRDHTMINLFILRDRISRSFENQVLATSDAHRRGHHA